MNSQIFLPGNSPLTVAVVNSKSAWSKGLHFSNSEADLLELRLDSPTLKLTRSFMLSASSSPLPLLITARHPDEGGLQSLDSTERIRRLRMLLPFASFIDIELRSVKSHRQLIEEAKTSGVTVVISLHDFKGTPRQSKLLASAEAAADHGADLIKIACTPKHVSDLNQMTGFLDLWKDRTPWAVMGMGELGSVSRLLFARLGSRLNYGYIGKPQVPGQWPAALLKQRIAELFELRSPL
jgi:3-dehydroquinate dehydratase-1